MNAKRLHLGCGREILAGYVNLDSAKLPGVDVVQDLRSLPWPFPDNQFDEILIKHVLEHLADTLTVMNEIWRISAPRAKVVVRVPYWNSDDFITDPTHIKAFNEQTFNFFDPDHPSCRERSYYSPARFRVRRKVYFVKVAGRYFEIRSRILCRLLECLATFFCNVIQVMEFELEAIK